jgi:hypothetical protein
LHPVLVLLDIRPTQRRSPHQRPGPPRPPPATLAAVSAKTTYICGFQIGSTATAAAAGNATITGTITGTLNFEMGTGTSPAVVQTQSSFNPCIPASGTNQSIAVVSAAPGTGGVICVTAWGFQE